ncbi:HhH-GDP family DNA glycosylase [Rhizomonospora bruguierae]|uniref:hypothetical protein n=1 Tax=Rhizomonospora bruguierae TaxID=1581705 RepID=UPI001BCBD476|nr:hypothetical protein [Micromonospora sp. NBRC 107566]
MTQDRIVAEVLRRHGETFAERAGIRLADKPSPLYRLLVLATLLSARITAEIAVAAARELSAAGYTTPEAMRDATWQRRVDALGRGHYRRYDERTATMLGDAAVHCVQRWRGDLRRLHAEAPGDARVLSRLVREFKGIGPTGAAIFLREVQGVWPDIAPYADERVAAGARRLGLPPEPAALARLVSAPDLPRFAAALVVLGRDEKAAEALRGAAD